MLSLFIFAYIHDDRSRFLYSGFSEFKISGILNGQSIVLFGDIFIIALVFVTLFTKKLLRGSTPIVVLIILALVGMLGVFRYGFNIDIIGLFFRSRIIFVLLVTIFGS